MPDLSTPHQPYAALKSPNYRRFALGYVLSACGLQMLGTAVGWEIYERTGDALHLGYAGLARALPVLVLALPAGHLIDRLSRKRVLVMTQIGMGVAAAVLAAASYTVPMEDARGVWAMYVALVLMGCARSFNGPSRSSLLPAIVGPRDFHNAVTWNSGIFQLSSTVGPILAGLMIAWWGGAWPVYLACAVTCFVFAVTASALRPRARAPLPAGGRGSMLSGASHVWREKTILGTITLDLFAVLLGGATALLPVYAKDILKVGPEGLGLLRASPYVGSFVMAIVLAHRPPFKRAGRTLLLSVAGFGACTIVFGFCGEFGRAAGFAVALASLGVAGAMDSISVVVRHVLVQVRTPDHLRGRVSAVNSVFIESSNELGAFESGLVARFFGPVFSVVSGGIGTLVVVGAVALALPQLRRLGRLELEEEDGACPACGVRLPVAAMKCPRCVGVPTEVTTPV